MEYVGIKAINFKELVGERVYVTFLCKEVSVGNQRNGCQFMSITMKQNEVEENAKLFEASKTDIDEIKAGKVYKTSLDIKAYDKAPNGYACVIVKGTIEECVGVSAEPFLEWTNGVNEARNGILNYTRMLGDSWYGKVVTEVMNEVWQRFSCWSAAKSLHHEQLGGLVVHTYEVVTMSVGVAQIMNSIYGDKFINVKLLIAASILHDVGKVIEINTDFSNGVTDYSTEAVLVSHIMSGISIIDRTAYKIMMTEQVDHSEELNLLRHVVASHHGKKEWGSPITPSVPEANIIHMADEMSAQMYRYNKELSKIAVGESSTSWINGEMYSVYKDSTKQ